MQSTESGLEMNILKLNMNLVDWEISSAGWAGLGWAGGSKQNSEYHSLWWRISTLNTQQASDSFHLIPIKTKTKDCVTRQAYLETDSMPNRW